MQSRKISVKNLKVKLKNQSSLLSKSEVIAVEGCVWITPNLDEKWQDMNSRKRLLDIIHTTEYEETLMGLSPHFLVIGRK